MLVSHMIDEDLRGEVDLILNAGPEQWACSPIRVVPASHMVLAGGRHGLSCFFETPTASARRFPLVCGSWLAQRSWGSHSRLASPVRRHHIEDLAFVPYEIRTAIC